MFGRVISLSKKSRSKMKTAAVVERFETRWHKRAADFLRLIGGTRVRLV